MREGLSTPCMTLTHVSSWMEPSQIFSCLHSEQKIYQKFVNDGFCDCEDGSDEPGTAACKNGSNFHCFYTYLIDESKIIIQYDDLGNIIAPTRDSLGNTYSRRVSVTAFAVSAQN